MTLNDKLRTFLIFLLVAAAMIGLSVFYEIANLIFQSGTEDIGKESL